jgi:hypothetical protein
MKQRIKKRAEEVHAYSQSVNVSSGQEVYFEAREAVCPVFLSVVGSLRRAGGGLAGAALASPRG